MKSSQELIHGLITEGVYNAGVNKVILLEDGEYSNTGVLRTLRTGTFEQIAAVRYDYQKTYCHFYEVGKSDSFAALWYDESNEGKRPYVKGSIPELVQAVTSYLLKGET